MNTEHQDHTCLFCKIIRGEVPAEKIYEDEHTFAFLDIHPVREGHALVVPKYHTPNIYSIPDEVLQQLILTVKKISIAVKEGTDADGINLVMNNDKAASQLIFHAHIHVIPRAIGDDLVLFPHKSYHQGEMPLVAEKIRSLLI